MANNVGQLIVDSDMPATSDPIGKILDTMKSIYALFFWKHEVLIFYLFLISGTNVIGAQSAPGSKNLAPPEMLLVEPSHPTKYALVVYAF